MSSIILNGNIRLGHSSGALVDVAADVFKLEFIRQADGIERPGSFADLRKTTVPGQFAETVVVSYEENFTGASAGSFADMIYYHTFGGGSGVLYGEATFSDDTVSAANKKFAFSISVLDASLGGEIGQLRMREATFPVLTFTPASS